VRLLPAIASIAPDRQRVATIPKIDGFSTQAALTFVNASCPASDFVYLGRNFSARGLYANGQGEEITD